MTQNLDKSILDSGSVTIQEVFTHSPNLFNLLKLSLTNAS